MDDSEMRLGSAASSETFSQRGSSVHESSRRAKKVRLACERCRYRRIKCDGQVPACSNCRKSGSVCIDVDSHNSDRKVSRSFLTNASARIAWLEDIIRTQLPNINLNDGPDVNASLSETAAPSYLRDGEQLAAPQWVEHSPHDSSTSEFQYGGSSLSRDGTYAQNPETLSTVQNHGLKRPISSIQDPSNRESSVEQDTRSVALDLGLLSLNTDSRQLHYLGSSSGSLLASLVQAGTANYPNRSGSKGTSPLQEVDDSAKVNNETSNTAFNSVQFDVMRTTISSLYAQLRKDLPLRKDCDTLCNQFFSQLHPNHPFLHRPSFNWMIDSLYICAASEPRCLLQHNGWPVTVQPFDYNGEEHISNGRKLIPIPVHVAAFQLFLVLSIGAILQIRRRLYYHVPGRFFSSALSLSNHVFSGTSLPSLQALLLLLVHSLVEPGGPDIWTLTHLAMAHCVDLGFHREVGENMKFSRVAVEMRRRVFYSIYSFDRSTSTIQGRPFSLGDDYYDVNLPSTNNGNFANEEVSSDNSSSYEYMDFSIHLFKLTELVSKIKTTLYRLSKPSSPWPRNLLSTQREIRNELEQWVSEVPSVILNAPAELKLRLTIKLKIQYHGALCLLYQPSQAFIQPSDQALKLCYENAAERLRLYETSYESGNLVFSWRTVQDLFLAGSTVMYCVWISKAVRDIVTLPALASICRRCSSLLGAGGEWWPMIQKSRLSLERLASHTIEMFVAKSRSVSPLLNMSTATPYFQPNSVPVDSSDWLSANIPETLASVLNHDQNGQLSNIFGYAPYNPYPIGASNSNDDPANFDDSFWAAFDGYGPNVQG